MIQPLLRTLAMVCVMAMAAPSFAAGKVTLKKQEGKVAVHIDGELFTQYIFKGYEKPILYPVIGPHGIGMTRNWPMKKGVEGEAKDHPHHKSIWFGHMKVNGHSFWHVGNQVEQTELTLEDDTIKTQNKLKTKKGEVVATDTRVIRFWADGDNRFIEYNYTYHASEGDLKFGDNKDGQMGIRMNAQLRIKGKKAKGKAINSEGVTEKKIWGKRAKWVDYWGPVDGKVVGVAVFDHPTNFRHPTWWHARDYGLLSANPWGIHHFEKKKKHLGEHTLKKGESLTFRHLFVFHKGDYKEADVAGLYRKWVAQTTESKK
ncbi:MAG: PmoA family protein [Phycisphaeraceae bacterium]|nr:PmoA family protein [Phycisphaeraceae bacterium]